MENINIRKWVSEAGPEKITFRQAVYTLLFAISSSDYLRDIMFLKGGLLLAIRYKSTRHTIDADFSTPDMYTGFDKDKFLAILDRQLILAVESLDYNLDCQVQKCKVNPEGEDKTFQELKMTIGYAYKGSKEHKKLIRGECPHVLTIDYSFNEQSIDIDIFRVDEGNNKLLAYSLPDSIAEKFRSIIQQKVRNRSRRQDAYDIHLLMEQALLDKTGMKERVFKSLILKSKARNLEIDENSLRDPEIIRRSKIDFERLSNEIEGPLPSFEDVFSRVRDYYESLPWKK